MCYIIRADRELRDSISTNIRPGSGENTRKRIFYQPREGANLFRVKEKEMSNVLSAKVTIVGTRPLIQHKFGPDALPLEKQERTGVAGNSPDEWRKTAMVTKDGQLFVLPTYIFSCLREGARHTPKKRGTLLYDVSATL